MKNLASLTGFKTILLMSWKWLTFFDYPVDMTMKSAMYNGDCW